MSYKTFQNGFPLPASDLNNYLMNQVVATFANSAARSSAIASPQEGQVTYLESDEKYYKYDGSNWVELAGMTSQVSQALSPNYIINGAFDIWQRGTSFSNTVGYSADRFKNNSDGNGVYSITRQSFTPAEITAVGFGEASFYLRHSTTTAATYQILEQQIEDVRTLAGQTVTLSYWAKVNSGTLTNQPSLVQIFGSGGSAEISANTTSSTITTSWQRFSHQFTVPSISGKTIGANSNLTVRFLRVVPGSVRDVDIWGVQLEAGSVATPFRRNANSLQGELAACQRYYVRFNQNESAYAYLGTQGIASSTTNINFMGNLPVSMRVTPTSVEWSGFHASDTVNNLTASAIGIDPAQSTRLTFNLAATVSGATQYRTYFARAFNNSAHYLAFNAEL